MSPEIRSLMYMEEKNERTSHTGFVIALAILLAWGATLALSLGGSFHGPASWLAIPVAALTTFLYTGVFITAHDAMHGLVSPRNRRLNAFLGSLCSILFALFSFKRLRVEHWKHHAEPASGHDPDYHDGERRAFARWYFRFLFHYVTWRQLLGMAVAYNVLHYGFGIPDFNLLALWVTPNVLSTLQLFYFGTYLPHREPAGGYDNPHRARSNPFPEFVSFITCYHFGYHYEHHQYPHVAWWDLPRVRRVTLAE